MKMFKRMKEMYQPVYNSERSSGRSNETSSRFSGISTVSNMSSREGSSTSSSNEDISSRSRESIDSFGSFKAAPTILQQWEMEYEKNYKGNEPQLVMSEMMGVELDSMQHNAIRKLIENNNFNPALWKSNIPHFPSNCNKHSTFKHCIYMGFAVTDDENDENIYLDQLGNFFDEEGNQYDVVGENPNGAGVYEFKIRKHIQPVHTTSSEKISSVNSNKNIEKVVQFSPQQDDHIQGYAQLSPEAEEYEETLEKYPITIALGKAILAIQDKLYLYQSAQASTNNVVTSQILSNDTEISDSNITRAEEVNITDAQPIEINAYRPDEKELSRDEKELKSSAIDAINSEENEKNAYDYMFTDSSLIKLFEEPDLEDIPISDSINIIQSIVYDFVKANTPPSMEDIEPKKKIENIEKLKKFLDDSGIKNITKALVLPENKPEEKMHFKNICEKLEIFLLQITSYIHTNTCTTTLTQKIGSKLKQKANKFLTDKSTDDDIQLCEKNKYFIYDQIYKMLLGFKAIFEALKENYPPDENDIIDNITSTMEKILEILKYYTKYYKKHRDNRSDYGSSMYKGGKTQRKRKTRKHRKTKNKAKSHKKRIRIKSRKLR